MIATSMLRRRNMAEEIIRRKNMLMTVQSMIFCLLLMEEFEISKEIKLKRVRRKTEEEKSNIRLTLLMKAQISSVHSCQFAEVLSTYPKKKKKTVKWSHFSRS